MKASATYKVEKWKEETWKDISPEVKMTKASVEFSFQGEIEGKTTVEYLMFYKYFNAKDQHKALAEYVGMMQFDGKLNGKSGSFALEDKGVFEAGAAQSTLKILEGSATNELKGIKGIAQYRADAAGNHFELDYDL
jgi:hypothetical protein